MKILFKAIMGSQAYGTNTPTSDEDIRGVGIKINPKYYFGLSNFEQLDATKDKDITIYSLKKFFSLALKGNPNILEILYQNNPQLIKEKDSIWDEMIIPNRHLFLSKKVKDAYLGYAYAQIHRMENHRKWYDNPPQEPKVENYFIKADERYEKYKDIFIEYDKSTPEEAIKLKKRIENFIDNLHDRTNVMYIRGFHSKMVVKYRDKIIEKEGHIFNEAEYDKALKEYNDYITWKTNRNEKRSALEEKSGYDTKHAYHCMRLLDQCEDIFRLKTLRVMRDDRVSLWRDIRDGKYTYEEFRQMYDDKIKILEYLFTITELPSKPDFNKVEKLCIDIHRKAINIIPECSCDCEFYEEYEEWDRDRSYNDDYEPEVIQYIDNPFCKDCIRKNGVRDFYSKHCGVEQ